MKKRSFEAGRQVKAYAANRPIQRRNWLNRIEYSPNLQALSLFRILFAGYLFVHFLSVLPYYSDFYGAAGIMPLSALATDQTLYGVANMSSLVRLFDALGIGAIAPAAYPLSLVVLALGYRTRWACGIALVLDAYIFWRNPVAVTGAEVLGRLLLLGCLFLPINRYWSVDAALDRLPRRRPWPALPFIAIRFTLAGVLLLAAHTLPLPDALPSWASAGRKATRFSRRCRIRSTPAHPPDCSSSSTRRACSSSRITSSSRFSSLSRT
jgi:hypothetical protein